MDDGSNYLTLGIEEGEKGGDGALQDVRCHSHQTVEELRGKVHGVCGGLRENVDEIVGRFGDGVGALWGRGGGGVIKALRVLKG